MTALQSGSAAGLLCGGNLSLLCASLGTPWEIDTRGKLLFLEDIGEQTYRVDAMLTQLRNAGKFDDCEMCIRDRPKNAQLVEAEEDNQDAARPGEEGLIPGEEPARGGKAQAQKEEGEGHPQDEEKGVPQHPLPAVADRAVRLHGPGTPGEIADIEGNQGQDTGGEYVYKRQEERYPEQHPRHPAHFYIR